MLPVLPFSEEKGTFAWRGSQFVPQESVLGECRARGARKGWVFSQEQNNGEGGGKPWLVQMEDCSARRGQVGKSLKQAEEGRGCVSSHTVTHLHRNGHSGYSKPQVAEINPKGRTCVLERPGKKLLSFYTERSTDSQTVHERTYRLLVVFMFHGRGPVVKKRYYLCFRD